MHEGATIRGGGIILLLGVGLYSLFTSEVSIYFSLGLFLLGSIGFVDDLISLPSSVRFPIQLISILLILADLEMYGCSILSIILIVIVATGILNAYNFMDGINGITGGYSLVVLISLLFVNNQIHQFVNNEFLIIVILATLVFSFFNFRAKAICFAGDVGSLSIAFMIVYLILRLINTTGEFIYILFLTFYGIDTVFTIIQRLNRRENIFEAHRLHLFQVIVSKTGMSHLFMSFIYMVGQAIVNFIVILLIPLTQSQKLLYAGVLLSVLAVVYILVKRKYNWAE